MINGILKQQSQRRLAWVPLVTGFGQKSEIYMQMVLSLQATLIPTDPNKKSGENTPFYLA